MNNRLFSLKYDFLSALQHLKTKWIHSVLSVLGIVISISSIIVMISISDGAKKKTIENIRNLGINTIRIKNKPYSHISNQKSNKSSGLNIQDLKLINRIVNKYGYSSMTYKLQNKSIYFSNGDTTSLILGVNENYHLIEQLNILKGRPILENDLTMYRTVAVISKNMAYKYNININDSITFNNIVYTIIGISDIKDNFNNYVLFPHNVLNLNNKVFDEINIFIEDKNKILLFANAIKKNIIKNHNNIENFIVNIPLEIISNEEETQNVFNIVLLSIALMSLLTGGISVMNAVLSNINEQTREIGLKLALGATPIRIIRFYLLYTVLLTVIGGLLGGLFGFTILFLLTLSTKIFIIFSIKAFIIGITMSVLSGLVFGIYPALRASKIEPILALREF